MSGPNWRCIGPWPLCGHPRNTCTASPAYQAAIKVKHANSMTTPDISGLCEGFDELLISLRSETDSHPRGGRRLVNPDGPEAADTLERQAAEIERLREAMEGLVDDLERRHRQVAEVCDEMQQQANDGYSYHRLVGKQAAYHHAAELAYQALSYKG